MASCPYTLTEPVPHTFLSVNRRNSESVGPDCNVGPRLHYCVDLRIQAYAEPVPLKYGKLATEYLQI